MKHVAIILAGGVSRRMETEIPKQFLILKNKPVIVHTIENFEKSPSIDSILLVCIDSWISHMKDLADQYNLEKVKWIVSGGDTVHDSTWNAITSLKNELNEDDYVIIHDAARPILPQKAIDEMLKVAHINGNASLAIHSHETLIYTDDQISGNSQLDRNRVMRVQTPQTYRYGFIRDLYEKADKDEIHDIVYADLVAIHYGKTVFFSKGFVNNIKITRKEDLALCEALMGFTEEQLF